MITQQDTAIIRLLLFMLIMGLICSMFGCKKSEIPIIKGKYYNVKSNIFHSWQYQPVNPVRVDSLYIDPLTGLPYAACNARQKNPDGPAHEWYIPQEDLH